MYPQDQIDELKGLYSGLSLIEDVGVQYFLMPNLVTPKSCVPDRVDALLCPSARDGYTSRLFFARQVAEPLPAKLERQRRQDRRAELARIFMENRGVTRRLAQMVSSHLSALV